MSTGEVWYLGAPLEVDEAILREVGLTSGAQVTSAGWRQITAAKARRLAKTEASARPRRRLGAVGRWIATVAYLTYAAVVILAVLDVAGVLR